MDLLFFLLEENHIPTCFYEYIYNLNETLSKSTDITEQIFKDFTKCIENFSLREHKLCIQYFKSQIKISEKLYEFILNNNSIAVAIRSSPNVLTFSFFNNNKAKMLCQQIFVALKPGCSITIENISEDVLQKDKYIIEYWTD